MVMCRKNPCPLEVIFDYELLQNWEPFLSNLFHKKPKSRNKVPFTIMKCVLIKALKNGVLLCSKTYLCQYEVFSYWCPLPEIGCCLNLTTEQCPFPQVNPLKVKDVRDLYKFLQEEDITFIGNMISKSHQT